VVALLAAFVGTLAGTVPVVFVSAMPAAPPSAALRLEVAFDYWESDGEKDAWGSFTVREAHLSNATDPLDGLRGRTGVLRLEGTAPPTESLGRIRRARIDLTCPELRDNGEALVRVKLQGVDVPVEAVVQLDYTDEPFDELVPPERCGPGG